MGKPKTPAKPARQRTISSFFALKTPAASAKSPVPSGSSSEPTAPPTPVAPLRPAAPLKPTPPPKPAAAAGRKRKAPPEKKPVEPIEEEAAEEQDESEDDAPATRQNGRPSKPVVSDDDDEFRGSTTEPDEPVAKRRRAPKKRVEEYERHTVPVSKKPKLAPLSPQKTASLYRYDPTQTRTVAEPRDPERERQKQALRESFVHKLGRISLTPAQGGDEEVMPEEEEGGEEPALGPIAKRFGKGKAVVGGKKKAAAVKLTPLEKQVVDIKARYPDTVLVVEVGYKFRFFGEDARIASQNLSIMCIPGRYRFDMHPSEAHLDRFASASIPVHRLHVHVKRLVANGYKVGVVRQLETAALKAAGDNKSAPFERKLTNLYTKGTYVDDIDGMDGEDLSAGAGSGGASNTGFLLCVTEKPGGGTGTDEKVRVGIVAVQPSTGEVVYDEFDDGFMRAEIETRLLHSMELFQRMVGSGLTCCSRAM